MVVYTWWSMVDYRWFLWWATGGLKIVLDHWLHITALLLDYIRFHWITCGLQILQDFWWYKTGLLVIYVYGDILDCRWFTTHDLLCGVGTRTELLSFQLLSVATNIP